jgi:hypothetical protein
LVIEKLVIGYLADYEIFTNKKTSICLIVMSAIILIIIGGYLRIYHGNSYGLMFIGGMILLFLRFRE